VAVWIVVDLAVTQSELMEIIDRGGEMVAAKVEPQFDLVRAELAAMFHQPLRQSLSLDDEADASTGGSFPLGGEVVATIEVRRACQKKIWRNLSALHLRTSLKQNLFVCMALKARLPAMIRAFAAAVTLFRLARAESPSKQDSVFCARSQPFSFCCAPDATWA
jgi:hypothetical protein